ncbi:hypothetical protein OXPF_34490 [Oxobacter pfennigii]|uniref:Uncharacterized protein n=1 Tax=Oxobacter pfennigii TaxID=36849 RepID=A0A0P8W5R4_9CLOT|nr:hypothetical protein [Oxobacter pfennigii]KPU43017.1 hypothetical protein OXPF_34490 [Oxobacter pfennigii]
MNHFEIMSIDANIKMNAEVEGKNKEELKEIVKELKECGVLLYQSSKIMLEKVYQQDYEAINHIGQSSENEKIPLYI